MLHRILFATAYAIISLVITTAKAQVPPVEAYGQLPTVKDMALSPDGSAVTYLLNKNGTEAMSVYSFDKGPIAAVGTGGLKARYVHFAGNDHVIIRASENTRVAGFRGKFENSAAFSVSLQNQKPKMLAKNTKGIFPAQSGLGRIIGLSEGEPKVFMPAFMDQPSGDPTYDLLKVDLNNGRGTVHEEGLFYTQDWLVNKQGVVLAREDYNVDRQYYAVRTKKNGSWETIYEKKNASGFPFSILGAKKDESALIIVDSQKGSNFSALYELGFDGSISEPLLSRSDADIEATMVDDNGIVYGILYSGLYPSYDFFDDSVDASVETAQATFPDSAVYVIGWSEDWNTLLLHVTGGGIAGEYYRFTRSTNNMQKIADERAGIPRAAVAETNIVTYKARDELKIPSLLTWPLMAEERKNLPLIVMPHGGPESYDRVGFDWMAQYFASRGYAVLQPNFRGSDGFGKDFRDAGRGEWGRKMQDDVTDGVKALIKAGIADPERVCIVGASYGGYSALAGGAFTPDLYKCVVAIAPVTDLTAFLKDRKYEYGSNHPVISYWSDLIGDSEEERQKIKQISPVNSAEAFNAPVLLIHGKDDEVVPLDQSTAMERALKKAGKDVKLVKLKGEDHYLSVGDTRLETLKLMDAFVREHLPVN